MERKIHNECKEMILLFNQKEDVKFNEIAKLKTFGKDSYSSMKKEALIELLSPETVSYLSQYLLNDVELLTAMRWVGRGLLPSLAVFKIQVDKEINMNRKQFKV